MTPHSTRRSSIHEPSPDPALSHLPELVKIGVKGPGVRPWLEKIGIACPASLYDCATKDGAIIARVGSDEIIIEADPANSILAKFEQALLSPEPGVYRVEQQGVTIVMTGERAHEIFLQTCGIEMPLEPVNRIVYTRVAGVSCGIIPQQSGNQRTYRLWCDYTLAPYLWENLTTILRELL